MQALISQFAVRTLEMRSLLLLIVVRSPDRVAADSKALT